LAAGALVYAFHPLTITLSAMAMLEPTLMLVVALALWRLERHSWQSDWPSALLSVFAAWIRPEGALFALAVFIVCAGKLPRRKALLLGTVGALFVALPYLRNLLVAGTPAGYFNELSGTGAAAQLWRTLKFNGLFYAANMADTALPRPMLESPYGLVVVVVSFFWMFFARGLFFSLRGGDGQRARALYVVLIIGGHLFWVHTSARYCYPVLPFAAEIFFNGVGGKRWLRNMAFFAALAASLGALANTTRRLAAPPLRPPQRSMSWLKANTKPGDLMMVPFVETWNLYTGRRGVVPFYEDSPDLWYYKVVSLGVRYAISEGSHRIQSTPDRQKSIDRMMALNFSEMRDGTRFREVHADARENVVIMAVTPPAGFMEAYRTMEDAQGVFNAGGHQRAIAMLRELQARQAPLKRLDFILGTALLLTDDGATAVPYLARAAAAEPDFADARRNLAVAEKSAAKAAASRGPRL
jgi:hypothetical protein